MRPILRSVSNEAKPRAEPPPRPEPVAVPEPTAHLGHCWHCGALNGQSASVCWSCEASLRIVAPEPFAPRVEPVPAKLEEHASAAFTTGNEATIPSARAPREAREQRELREHREPEPQPETDRRAVPLLTIPVDMASEYPGPGQFAVTPPAPRRGWLFPALIAGLLVLVGGGGWLLFASAARDAQEATATSAAVLPAPPMAPMPDAPPADPVRPAQPLETLGVDPAPPVAAPQAFDPVATAAAAAPRPNPARLPKAAQFQRGKGRIAPPEPVVSAQPAPLARPAAPAGPCTPTVAALGLCTSPSN
jgi:hypothetical protein